MLKSTSANSANHPPSSTRDREYKPPPATTSRASNPSSQDEESSGVVKRWKSLRGSREREGRPNLQEGFLQDEAEYSASRYNGSEGHLDHIRSSGSDQTMAVKDQASEANGEKSPYPVYSDSVTQADPLTSGVSPILKENLLRKEPKDGMRKFMAGFGKRDKERHAVTSGGVVEREIPVHQSPNVASGTQFLDQPFGHSNLPTSSASSNVGKRASGWLKKEKEEKEDKATDMEDEVVAKIGELPSRKEASSPHFENLPEVLIAPELIDQLILISLPL